MTRSLVQQQEPLPRLGLRQREAEGESLLARTRRRPGADVASRLPPLTGVIQTVVLAHPGLIRPLNFNKISDLRELRPPPLCSKAVGAEETALSQPLIDPTDR